MKKGAAMIAVSVFALFVAMGVSGTLFGLVLPDVTATLGISLTYAGLVTTLFAIGRTAGSFAGGLGTDRLGARFVTHGGLLCLLGGLSAVALAAHTVPFFAGSLVMGIGFGAVDVTANASIASLYPERRAQMLSLLHGFYGIGSFVGPLALGLVLAWQSSWRAGAWAVTGVYLIAGLLYVMAGRAASRGERSTAAKVSTKARVTAPKPPRFAQLLRQPAFLLVIPVGFIYQGVSWSLSLWLPSFMTEVHGATSLQAASAVSVLFLGLTIGRFVNSLVTQRLGDGNMLLVGTSGALVSLAVGLQASQQNVALVALGLTGFFLSSLIPTSIAILTRLTPQAEGTASGAFITLSATGVLLFPWFLGVLSGAWGLRAGLGAGLVALGLLMVVVIALRRMLALQETQAPSVGPPAS